MLLTCGSDYDVTLRQVVLAPLKSLTHRETVYKFQKPNVIRKLFDNFRAIQLGEVEDPFGWVEQVDTSTREHMPSDLWDGLSLRQPEEAAADQAAGVPLRLLTVHAGLGGMTGMGM
jgi:hypothetical protein